MNRMFFLPIFICLSGFSANIKESACVNAEKRMIATFAKTGTIKGRIITMDNKPAEMVKISLKDAAKNTMTDDNGFFILKNVKEGNHTLIVSMFGLHNQEKQVFVKANEVSIIDIALPEFQQQLTEIIITSR